MTLHVWVYVYAAAMCRCLHYVRAPCQPRACVPTLRRKYCLHLTVRKVVLKTANMCLLLGATPLLACSRFNDLLRAGRSGDRIPMGRARFSAPVQTGSEAHPASYTVGTRSFPGVKRPGRGVDHPPPSGAEVNERVVLYLYSPSGPSWPVLG